MTGPASPDLSSPQVEQATKSAGPYRVRLPWPPAELSPNGRLHWAIKKDFTRAYRQRAEVEARNVRIVHQLPAPLRPPVDAWITFVVPDRQRRDLDNLLARLKPGLDGLVDARLLVDDSAAVLYVRVNPELSVDRALAGVVIDLAETQPARTALVVNSDRR